MIVQQSNISRLAQDFPAQAKPGKPLLHANDAPGRTAHQAAQISTALNFNLLASASPTLPIDKRLEAIERVFIAWPALCRLMTQLEQAAPKRSAAGLEQAQRLRDFAEAR